MPDVLIKILFVAFFLAIWAAVYAYMLWSTGPSEIEPDAATQELPGDEPPAVVSLLANRWRFTEDAAESTLLDLAARHWAEFRQPGNDPSQTTVHLLSPPADRPLTPYEIQLLEWVQSVSRDGVAPVTALTFNDRAEAKQWQKSFEDAVVADARARGLSRRRFSQNLLVTLIAGAALPVAAVASALRENSVVGGLWGGLFTFAFLYAFAARPLGERDTAAGRVAARRWLAVRDFLRGDEVFAELPPAAVAVWDRYLAYGAALGTTRVASTVLDLGMGDRTRVWSHYTGHWRQVRISYPRVTSRYGSTPSEVFVGAAVQIFISVMAFSGFGLRLYRSSGISAWALTVLLGLIVGHALYRVVRVLLDQQSSFELTGQVLWVEEWKVKNESQKVPHHHLAVDDGTTDETRAWALPDVLSEGVRVGEVVRIQARPWTRRVTAIQPV